MAISKQMQILLLTAGIALLAIYSFSTGYTVGKDIAANDRREAIQAPVKSTARPIEKVPLKPLF